MAQARIRRLNKEIVDCAKDQISGISVKMVDNSLMHLLGTFRGPDGTPYEGGIYDIDILIPEGYPFHPVKMKFVTKIYHPNVSSQSGAICLDILKDAWSPVLTLKSTLISLQSLLADPQPNDPQDAEVARHYLTDRASFDDTARFWAETYAGAPSKSKTTTTTTSSTNSNSTNGQGAAGKIALAGLDTKSVEKFMAMGFPQDEVIDVLKRLNYRGENMKKITDDQVVQTLLRQIK